MRQLIKMKRRVYTRIEGSLYAFVMLLLSMLSQDHHARISRQVNGNILGSSANSSAASALPSLSERASVNSRHLSASSTASLAAAQMVASSSGGGQSQDPARAYLSQQHQQHLQQPISVANNNNNNNQQQQVGAISSAAPQQQQGPQFNSVQPQQVGVGSLVAASPQQVGGGATSTGVSSSTPVMSTTFTFNPQTGQYQPTDLSTGLLTSPALVGQQVPATFNQQSNQQNFAPQLPNYATQQQQYNLPARQPGVQFSQDSSGSRYPAGNYQFSQQASNNFNQFVQQQQRQVGQFSRRNGAPATSTNFIHGNSRFNTNQYGQPPPQQQQQQLQQNDEEFYQQQQSGGDLNQYGGAFDSSIYGNYLPAYLPSGSQANHQLAINGGGFVGHPLDHSLVSPQPSSLAPVVQLPVQPLSATSSGAQQPPASFISTPDGGGHQQKNEPQCVAADNRHGTCYQASECIRRGGTPMGKCVGGSPNLELTGSSYVCCLFDVSCGQFAAERFVYFRNPNYPQSYDQSRMCRAKIGKLDKGICQFRLDLLRFDVGKPTNGNCSQDMFAVSGQNENYIVPKICGLNDGQHYYVGVDESGVITLHMMMMGFYRRSFEIMVTQIGCRSDYAAPAHCLQYYMGTHGTIKSFNYDDNYEQPTHQAATAYDLLPQASGQQFDGTPFSSSSGGLGVAPYGLQFGQQQQQRHHHHHQPLLAGAALNGAPNRLANIYQSTGGGGDLFGGYPNDLDYTMCIRKESGFCSITYQLSRGDQGLQPFAVGYQQPYGPLAANNDSYGGGSPANWQPVSTECRDDYLLIGGVRLCSGGTRIGGGGGGGGGAGSFNPFDPATGGGGASIQFAQNGTILDAAGLNGGQQFQQLQNQQNLLLQQLARLQQQQLLASSSSSSNVSYATGSNGGNNQAGQQQQQSSGTGNAATNQLDQQQAAIMQQLLLVQQQLGFLASTSGQQQPYGNNRPSSQFGSDLQGAIITDTTTGPFLLRFVSNLARNARGFHIDYRQNPCK